MAEEKFESVTFQYEKTKQQRGIELPSASNINGGANNRYLNVRFAINDDGTITLQASIFKRDDGADNDERMSCIEDRQKAFNREYDEHPDSNDRRMDEEQRGN